MGILQIRFLLVSALVGNSFSTWAGVRLPLNTLRDQSTTAHCWAYAMSHALESRALQRENLNFMFETERDVKYFVDLERMRYIYASKEDFFIGDYEGGWQIEFFESLLKHGKSIQRAERLPQVNISYPVLTNFFEHLPFVNIARPVPETGLTFEEAKGRLLSTEFANATAADNYIVDFLNRVYGAPQTRTQFLGQNIALQETAAHVLGADMSPGAAVEDAVVLVKPVASGPSGWLKYLEERYWGYRMPTAEVTALVRLSLDRGWPVTYDNVGHAMTIIGYEAQGDAFLYAVADSVPGKITWYTEANMRRDLNLITFFRVAIEGQLPPREQNNLAIFPPDVDVDALDNLKRPPGAQAVRSR